MSGKENAEDESNHLATQQREAMRRRDEKGLLPKALRKSLVTFNMHYAVNWWGQKPDSSELMMGDKKMEVTYINLLTENYVKRRQNKMKELAACSGSNHFQIGENRPFLSNNFPLSDSHHQSWTSMAWKHISKTWTFTVTLTYHGRKGKYQGPLSAKRTRWTLCLWRHLGFLCF